VYIGSAVAFSADGLTIAAGAPLADGGKGAVFCFRLNVDANETAWVTHGSPLPGTSYGDTTLDFSDYIALSDNGNILAVGEPGYASRSGRVRVYMWDTDMYDWKKVGQTLYSGHLLDQFGYAVALSGDGTRLVASAPARDTNGSSGNAALLNTGHVRIYQIVNGHWWLTGDISGDQSHEEYFGRSVSIANNGNVVAIGAPNGVVSGESRDGGSFSGSAAVYEDTSEGWKLRGNSHIDAVSATNFGWDLALNADGSRVVVSALGHVVDDTVIFQSKIFVFDYVKKKEKSMWVQKGDDIDYGYYIIKDTTGGVTEVLDLSGYSVDISKNGEIVGIGSPNQINGKRHFTGHASVFKDPYV